MLLVDKEFALPVPLDHTALLQQVLLPTVMTVCGRLLPRRHLQHVLVARRVIDAAEAQRASALRVRMQLGLRFTTFPRGTQVILPIVQIVARGLAQPQSQQL